MRVIGHSFLSRFVGGERPSNLLGLIVAKPFLQTIKVHRLAGGPFSASLPDLAGLQFGDERRDSNMAIIDPGATKRPNARHNYEARGFKVTEEMRKPPNEPREGVIFTSK